MALVYADRVKETASNKPNASTAFNLPDTGATGYRSFDSVLATNDTCVYCAENGTAWEVGLGTFTAATPDTLARTTIYASSNSGSAVDFSSGGDVSVFITAESSRLTMANNLRRNWLKGGRIQYSGTYGFVILPGEAVVNGTLLTWTGNINGSGTTNAGWTASSIMYVYLYNNSGTAAIEESATAPAYDDTNDCWSKTGDATRRLIGWFYSDSGKAIYKFEASLFSGVLRISYSSGSGLRVVNNAASAYATTGYTAITLAGIPVGASIIDVLIKPSTPDDGDDVIVHLASISLGANTPAPTQVRIAGSRTGAVSYVGVSMVSQNDPSTPTLYFSTGIINDSDADTGVYIDISGAWVNLCGQS